MISNKLTRVPADKTVSEIVAILVKANASSILIDYEKTIPDGLSFKLISRDGHALGFRLPANWKGILAALREDKSVPRKLVCQEHAINVCWRVMRDWLRAQLTLIEAGAAKIEEVMLPWAITNDGTTVGQRLLSGPESKLICLPAPKP